MYTIHFIWLGKTRIPREIINTWIPKKNDKYNIIIWRDYPDKNEKYDKDIEDLSSFTNRRLFNESEKYNQKSDILRLEILYLYGGVYMDCDIIRVGNKDIVETLTKNQDKRRGMFITLEKEGCVSNSLIYVKSKSSKIIKFMIEGLRDCKIRDNDNKYISVCQSTGPKYITKKLEEYGYNMNNILPYHFVNFGIDYSKTFTDPNFSITENMKTPSKNKDLRYNPDLNSIIGIQLWMGGKKTNYESVSSTSLLNCLNNYEKYKNFIHGFYECKETKSE